MMIERIRPWVQGKKVQGLIKHVGFSFHSTPEELEARKNNFFMKIWNPLSGLVITIWKYLLRILNIIWGYIKKAGIFLKNRYVELKNKREKNK